MITALCLIWHRVVLVKLPPHTLGLTLSTMRKSLHWTISSTTLLVLKSQVIGAACGQCWLVLPISTLASLVKNRSLLATRCFPISSGLIMSQKSYCRASECFISIGALLCLLV